MVERWTVPGSAPQLFLAGTSPLLRPDEQVFAAMVDGWRKQQLSRNLGVQTIKMRVDLVRRFQQYTNEFPWHWRPMDVEEFFADLRGERRARSTLRSYQSSLRMFCDYAADPRYQWTTVCEKLFGSHPAQVFFEWNTATHSTDYEGRPARRALTKPELQDLFDYADDQVQIARRSGNKGWMAAMRDAAALKAAYAWGLRRQEVAMLDVTDFGTNPHAPEFGSYGVLYVRWGKAGKGSTPKRRSVLTVFPWSVQVLTQWIEQCHDLQPGGARNAALWPSERSPRLSKEKLGARFAEYRDALRLPEELTLHCLRHSYVTHLIEDGYDALFVQQQVGHSHASTTALYTSVSSDFRTRTLRKVLDDSIGRALAVLRGDVVDGESLDGCLAVDAGVGSVVIVVMDPVLESPLVCRRLSNL
ncbi:MULTISPECIES: tyrosine-type recombinase/integrase [Nocardiaceae]|uniref:tyrosine-type recombinase/integrase n=1 Tax=Nocardiaceae TaxID=85025 RepID=UPI001D22A0AA|nr:site-specific recombinase XerD [Rhodococcus sp. PvP104]